MLRELVLTTRVFRKASNTFQPVVGMMIAELYQPMKAEEVNNVRRFQQMNACAGN